MAAIKTALFITMVCHTYLVASIMHRIAISDASSRLAVCNDGSDAVYYLKKTGSSKWIVFLESGGGCFNFDSCLARKTSEPYLFGSDLYPKTITGEDILSSSEKDNLFVKYNKVLIPYCSSDLWLGNTTLSLQDGKRVPFNVTFRGLQIFRAVIEDLGKQGLENATELWLTGSSAGGIGIANNAKFLQDAYQQLKLVVLTDSSWFINYRNMLSKLTKFTTAINRGILPACADTRADYPCCLSLFCMISNQYFPTDVFLFNIISRYDIYALTQGIVMPEKLTSSDTTRKIVSDMLTFGGEIVHSVRQTKTFSNVHSILVSCFQHAYLATSSLWSPGRLFYARSQTSFNLQSFLFRHSVQKGRWNNVAVNGATIKKILQKWNEFFVNSKPSQARNGSVLINKPRSVIEDSCRRIQCNPTCPKSIIFYSNESSWPNWSHWFVLLVYLTFIIICIFIKIFWTVQCRRESRLQNEFVNSLYDGANSLNAVGLPCCIPSNYIGLSCTDVEYTVTVEAHKRQVTEDRKLQWSNRFKCTSDSSKEKRRILKGVNAYFNPGQLVAIMGPSGSGKTTFLDILTGRKESRESKVNINGLNNNETREWFKRHSGYVLQLATPYYEELTVRENLTFSALMRLPRTMSVRNKLMRVEQVIGQTGLNDVADVIVGKSIGPGLSGGQKRRLCVAIQLLRVPSVLFLDEPTSGLDSASSLELLETLHGLTLSGRLVVLTIHQPRIEIFHMFDRILFLSNGHVAYYGSPIMAPTMIAEALKNSGEILDASNPADTIMDVLISKNSQVMIVEHYKESGEIEAIQKAVSKAMKNPIKTLSMKVKRYPSSLSDRLLSFDRRASKCQTTAQKLYLLMIFLLYGLALGSVYWQTDNGILLMSCYQVFLCASQLFMASVIHAHFSKAMPVFALEQAEGVGKSYELVIHAFIRIAALTVLPLFLCSAIIYLCTVAELDMWKFFITTIIHMQLNHVWIAIIMLSACSAPRYSTLICPMLSAVSGFAGGFLVPEPEMPAFYYWLFYINPTHWAYSSTMKVLINDVMFICEGRSRLECQQNMGAAILNQFGFDQVNPYSNMVIMIALLVIFLLSTMAAVELRYTDKLKRWRRSFVDLSNRCKQRFSDIYKSSRHGNVQRLIDEKDIEANGSCIKSPDTSILNTSFNISNPQTNNYINKHKSFDTDSNSDRLPLLLPVKVEPMLTGRSAQRNRPNTISEFALSDNLAGNQGKGTSVTRSNTFTYTGRPQKYQNNALTVKHQPETSSKTSVVPSIVVENATQDDDPISMDEERSRAESESEICVSKYLDSTPKQHEVYSSVFGNRPKSTRRRSVTKRLPENVKRSESVHIQRKASMLILAERRKSMTMQIAGFGETFAYFNEICSDKRPIPRRHAALGVKRKVEAKRQQRVSDGSSRASVNSVDLLKVPDINITDENVPMRRSRLLSQNAIDLPDDKIVTNKEDFHQKYLNNQDLQFHVPLPKNSVENRHDSYDVASAPRKLTSGIAEPVKVSALKISRKKLVPLSEVPENHSKFSEKWETESRSSMCRTPLGSIDEVEEDNEYFGSQRLPKRGPAIRKTSLQEAQEVHYFSEDFSEVADWLRKNSKTFIKDSEQSDSDSTTKGSVIGCNRDESGDAREVVEYTEKYLPMDLRDNFDTDEEIATAFHARKDTEKVTKEPIIVTDGLRSNDSGISSGFIRICEKEEDSGYVNVRETELPGKNGSQGNLGPSAVVGIAISSPSPKTFSNALYMIDNNENISWSVTNSNDCGNKTSSGENLKPNSSFITPKDLWETRSNDEFSTEHDSLVEKDTPSCKDSLAKGGHIRRTSSCEFEYDAQESVGDNDIAKIRSLRRKSKKRKIESNSNHQSCEKTKYKAVALNETTL